MSTSTPHQIFVTVKGFCCDCGLLDCISLTQGVTVGNKQTAPRTLAAKRSSSIITTKQQQRRGQGGVSCIEHLGGG
jgi:hypothetical protein